MVKKSLQLKKRATPQDDSRLLGVRHSETFEGPLPHPNHLAQYESVLPGTADRIIQMAEEQSSHRQFIEKKVIDSNIKNERLGMLLGTGLTVLVTIVGAILVFSGKSVAGWIALFGPGGFQVANYIWQKNKERSFSKQKDAANNPQKQ